jgi:hypothetical protein
MTTAAAGRDAAEILDHAASYAPFAVICLRVLALKIRCKTAGDILEPPPPPR